MGTETVIRFAGEFMAAMLPDNSRELLPKEHVVVYELRCLPCGHKWEDSTGWLPPACPKCGNRIEYGDHLPAHLEVIGIRFEHSI
jgi:DNA-directed RNA polymerase subunit RPC12/RpoP